MEHSRACGPSSCWQCGLQRGQPQWRHRYTRPAHYTRHVSAQSRAYTCTWQPLVAGQADGPGVVVGAHGGWRVLEDDLPGLDVPGGDEQPPAALLVVDGVVHGGVCPTVLCFDCGQLSPVQTNTNSAVQRQAAGGKGKATSWARADTSPCPIPDI